MSTTDDQRKLTSYGDPGFSRFLRAAYQKGQGYSDEDLRKPVTRLERADLREAIRGIPLDRLLLETDTYPLPGRTTEPRDIADIARAVGELRGESYEAIATATTTNFLRLFDHNRSST